MADNSSPSPLRESNGATAHTFAPRAAGNLTRMTVVAFTDFVNAGKIRGWGMCNDNTYGLMASTMAARELGVEPPCVMQNDYSLINRRIEENGLSEASAPWNENVGFMGYNVLAGGMLPGIRGHLLLEARESAENTLKPHRWSRRRLKSWACIVWLPSRRQ